ncbi:MAG: acyltransferase [Oxalobacter sp.]|nr:acyltransferase [Oxalobacter sp.]
MRALAVFAVFVFHAFPKVPVFKGGFVGVDVFFVISGFLISSIIYTQLAKGTFSFWDFYSRRIRRIYPVLLTVLIGCLGFGWFFLLADEYMQLSKHIAGGAGFVSNFVLFFEKGYFDNASATKPLLHLWSLGIEEQFYIFWPLILWLTWKLKKNAMFWVALVIATVSMAMNLYWFKSNPSMDFFLPHTRVWELLCGAILAWGNLNWKEKIVGKVKDIRGGGYPAPYPFSDRIRLTRSIHHLHAGKRLSGLAGNHPDSSHSLNHHGRERRHPQQMDSVQQSIGLVWSHQLSDVLVALAADIHGSHCQIRAAACYLLCMCISCLHRLGMADDKTH